MAPGGQVGVAAVAAGLGVHHDHPHAGFDEVVPVLMFLGIAFWRTRNSMVGVVGDASWEILFQSFATTPLSARNRIVGGVFMVTTSAARPSFTARAWALEPACDWSIFTSCPVVFFVVRSEGGVVVL